MSAPRVKSKISLEGSWVIESATCGGEQVQFRDEERNVIKRITWQFGADKFVAFLGGPKDAYEEGTFRIDTQKSPNHLDLTPTKGELLTTRKCIFELEGDELKIAFSIWLAPGNPEDETNAVRKCGSTRPEKIGAQKSDLTLLLVLKRQKK